MRDLTKAMLSFSWAVPFYGFRQAINLADPRVWSDPSRAEEAFDDVTKAMKDQLGESLADTFEAFDKMQRQAVDAWFGVFDFDAFNIFKTKEKKADGEKAETKATGAAAEPEDGGWGPVGGKKGWGPMPKVG